MCIFLLVVQLLFTNPLMYLYRNGPRPLFWEGMNDVEICATITSVPAAHWELMGQGECEDMLVKKYTSFATSFTALVYVLLLYHIFTCVSSSVWTHFTVTRPLLRTVRDVSNLFNRTNVLMIEET